MRDLLHNLRQYDSGLLLGIPGESIVQLVCFGVSVRFVPWCASKPQRSIRFESLKV